ncbi:MAG: restriction endonuclease subunit S [Cytophagia bacterium]|nr:restriction endonuclease subunit S [Cytophagia bacterium]
MLVELNDVLDYVQPTKYLVESTDYSDDFETPVLTAGKSFLLGYTNEKEGIYSETPVIIFDDFTTSFHFVDFPFKVKSSALKILKRKNDEVDIKYVYYAMSRIQFEPELHKRYWISKYSKFQIPLPPLATQKKIADILDAADAHRQKTKQLLAKYDELAQSIFLEMFGDPVTNPKGWVVKSLKDVSQRINVGFVGTCDPFYTDKENGIPMIRTGNLGEGELRLDKLKYVTKDFHDKQKKSQIFPGDILIARHGDNGKAVVYEGVFDQANTLNIVIVTPKKRDHSFFIEYILNSSSVRDYIQGFTGGATQKVINTKALYHVPVFQPNHDQIMEFNQALNSIKKSSNFLKMEILMAEDLLNSLLQKAFKGELV